MRRPNFLKPLEDRSGAVAMIFALLALPLLLCVALGADMARLVVAQSELQAAVDSSALAGASAYQSSSVAIPIQAASNYFSRAALFSAFKIDQGSPNISASGGSYPVNGTTVPSNNVTVQASGTMPTTFLSMIGIKTLALNASATAANPAVYPVVTFGSTSSTAYDWNSAYMYAVPLDANGNPQFGKLPALSQMYEIGSNCNSSMAQYNSNSRCIGQYGSVKPTNQAFPTITATTPIAFLFVNMNNGLISSSSSGYGNNAYGAAPGNWELANTAWMNTSVGVTSNQGPWYNTDNSPSIVQQLSGYYPNQSATHYSQLNGTSKPNCALIIAQVDPTNLPSNPPSSEVGHCMSDTDTVSGAQFANMSCSQIAGRTFMYWWNDGGGGTDDYDYKNLYYTLQCKPGSGSSDGGAINGSSLPAGYVASVQLVN